MVFFGGVSVCGLARLVFAAEKGFNFVGLHNLTGGFGVMAGAESDLRTGLPWQMVEIHEAMRFFLRNQPDNLTLVVISRTLPPLGIANL